MSNFQDAIPIVLRNEGGYVDNPDDAGKATNYGVSTVWLLSHPEIGVTDAKLLTVSQACSIYETYWWNAYNYGNILDQTISCKIFDLSVNLGPESIGKIVQTVLNTQFWCKLTVDGDLGPISIKNINSIDTLTTQQTLINAISDATWQHYQDIIQANPQDTQFAEGWKNRAYNISQAGSII